MSPQRIVGLILIVLGIVLLVIGLNATDSVGERVSNFFTGHFTEKTTWYLILGAVAAVGGVALLAVGGRKSA